MPEEVNPRLCQAGHEGGPNYRLPLPRRRCLVVRGDPSIREIDYEVTIDSDAAFDYGRKMRGLGWILRPVTGDTIRESWADFHTTGGAHNCAELSAMVGGLVRARAEGSDRVIVRSDSQFATEILAGLTRPAADRVKTVTAVLHGLIPKFELLALKWCPAAELAQADRLSRTFMRGTHAVASNEARFYLLDVRGGGTHYLRRTFPEIAPWTRWGGKFP